jgi:hypothetical protein
LIKDDLALRLFTLGNFVCFFGEGNIIGASFLVPFVRQKLAIRNSMISDNANLALLQAAFSAFFRMAKNYATIGKAPGICENSSQAGHQKNYGRQACAREDATDASACIGLSQLIRVVLLSG